MRTSIENGELQVEFNGDILNRYAKVLDVKRSAFGEISVPTRENPLGGVVVLGEPRTDAQYATVDFMILNDAPENLNELRRIVKTKEPKDFVVSDEPYKTSQAILIGASEYDDERHTRVLSLEFMIPKGYGKGETKTADTIPATIIYEGTAVTLPIITIEFTDATDGVVISRENDDGEVLSVSITNTFEAGDVLVINCETEYVTLNGADAMPSVDIISDFFGLERGQNDIEIVAKTGALNATAEIQYTENWY